MYRLGKLKPPSLPEICIRVSYKDRIYKEVFLSDVTVDSYPGEQRILIGETTLAALNMIRKEYHTRLPKPCDNPTPGPSLWERALWRAGWYKGGGRTPLRFRVRCKCGWPVGHHGRLNVAV
jgi:hypothetical protein